MARIRTLPLVFILFASMAFSQKKPLDASAYDIWKSVRSVALSNNGKWLMYTVAPQDGDVVVEIKATDGSKSYAIDRGSPASFTEDCRFVVATVVPKNEDTKKARRAKAKPEDMPKNGLTILNLETGQRTDVDKVTSFSIAPHDSGWIAYRMEPPKPAPKAEPSKDSAERSSGKGSDDVGPATAMSPPQASPTQNAEPARDKKPGPKADHKPGDTWVVRNLASAKEEKLEGVNSAKWSKDGAVLVYALSTQDGAGDGVAFFDTKTGAKKTVAMGLGKYPKIAVSDITKDVAFVTDKDDYQAKKPALALYLYRAANGKLAKVDASAVAKDFVLAENGNLQFSDKGTRLAFATAPRSPEEKKDDTPDDEKVSVDIWNWQDKQMMPQQLLQADTERKRTYDAVLDLSTGIVQQLENPHLRTVVMGAKGDGEMALGTSNEAYMREGSWAEAHNDYVCFDLAAGKSGPLLTRFGGSLAISPGGKYAYGYDEEGRDFACIDLKSGKRTSLSKTLPVSIVDDDIDTPSLAPSYGSAGWTAGDAGILLYDKYDVWLVDPTGAAKPVSVTHGQGRAANLRLRLVKLDPEADFVDLSKPQLLSAFNDQTKQAGYYKLDKGSLERLIMKDRAYAGVFRARNAEVYAFQEMDVNQYPDVWVAGANLENARKVSDANPQQKDYNWTSAELVKWIGNDGQVLQGILHKPENFDPSKKYPMITYYYEKSSDTIHQYFSPAPSASVVNFTMYCSNGYLIFEPDIPYKIGYPGESAMSAILPGVQSIVARGYVDPKRLGLQGQSWGGYETGFLVTQTNMFAAACAGAPVADMVSAYGGIRWESGVSREGQYEHGQSRIGGSLWEEPLRFIQNSPIFFADKIRTPLLIMSNDHDGAVPWYQGIEYFSALRRLNKPAWLVCYNDEAHNLVQRKNRKDWSLRMQQFFDHYLKGAPMPVWMSQGVPATEKGKTYGFDLVPGTAGK